MQRGGERLRRQEGKVHLEHVAGGHLQQHHGVLPVHALVRVVGLRGGFTEELLGSPRQHVVVQAGEGLQSQGLSSYARVQEWRELVHPKVVLLLVLWGRCCKCQHMT